jgi:hypothetical protein
MPDINDSPEIVHSANLTENLSDVFGLFVGFIEMLDFLQAGTNDFVQNALADASRDVKSIRTKIGVIDKLYWSQTSLVERNLADHVKPIRYVISILNNKAPFLLTKGTIEPLDQGILNRHPGAAPP